MEKQSWSVTHSRDRWYSSLSQYDGLGSEHGFRRIVGCIMYIISIHVWCGRYDIDRSLLRVHIRTILHCLNPSKRTMRSMAFVFAFVFTCRRCIVSFVIAKVVFKTWNCFENLHLCMRNFFSAETGISARLLIMNYTEWAEDEFINAVNLVHQRCDRYTSTYHS